MGNLVLLCDTDHGLAHDQDLVMTRRNGRLIVTTPDGRRVWGTADAAYTGGIHELATWATPAAQATRATGGGGSAGDLFIGVHPIDQRPGRRPQHPSGTQDSSRTSTPAANGAGSTGTGSTSTGTAAAVGSISRLVFPDGEPDLPDAMHVNGERMNLAWAVGVLMGNRDLLRRLQAETGGQPVGCPVAA